MSLESHRLDQIRMPSEHAFYNNSETFLDKVQMYLFNLKFPAPMKVCRCVCIQINNVASGPH